MSTVVRYLFADPGVKYAALAAVEIDPGTRNYVSLRHEWFAFGEDPADLARHVRDTYSPDIVIVESQGFYKGMINAQKVLGLGRTAWALRACAAHWSYAVAPLDYKSCSRGKLPATHLRRLKKEQPWAAALLELNLKSIPASGRNDIYHADAIREWWFRRGIHGIAILKEVK